MKLDKPSQVKRWRTLWQLLILLLLFILIFNGCGGSAPLEDVAEAPVAEVVDEVEEEIEEEAKEADDAIESEEEVVVEAEVEVEVTQEVEVIVEEEIVVEETGPTVAAPTQAPELDILPTLEALPTIEAQPTQAPEAAATQAPTLGESEPDDQDISATGSEEDEGSPFTSTGGQKGVERSTEEKIEWLSAVEEFDPLTVRVLADHADSLVIQYSLETPFFEETVILTRNILFYSYLPAEANSGEADAIFLDLPVVRWEAILETLSLDRIAELSATETGPTACIDCPDEMPGERLTIITPDEVHRFNIDSDSEIEEETLAALSRLIRIVAIESRVRVRTVVRQIE